jgi:hypothetical protein
VIAESSSGLRGMTGGCCNKSVAKPCSALVDGGEAFTERCWRWASSQGWTELSRISSCELASWRPVGTTAAGERVGGTAKEQDGDDIPPLLCQWVRGHRTNRRGGHDLVVVRQL